MKKRNLILLIVTIFLAISSIGGGFLIIKQRQQMQEKAAPATSIYFKQESITKTSKQAFNIDILVDTGTNNLAIVCLDIDYNQSVLEIINIEFNNQLLPQLMRAIDFTSQPGKIFGSAGVFPGTSVSGQGQKIAVISFKAIQAAPQGTIVSFASNTTAYSATKEEEIGNNLISQKRPLNVIVLGGEETPTPQPTNIPTPQSTVITTTTPPTPPDSQPTAMPTSQPAVVPTTANTLTLQPTTTPVAIITTIQSTQSTPTTIAKETPQTAFSLPILILFSIGSILLGGALFAI